jgi:hypothetical protein
VRQQEEVPGVSYERCSVSLRLGSALLSLSVMCDRIVFLVRIGPKGYGRPKIISPRLPPTL